MIIDFGATPPVPELKMQAQDHLANYRRVYAASEKAAGRANADVTLDDFLANAQAAGIAKTVIKARDIETTFGGKIRNEDVAAVVQAHPDHFIGFAGVDPHKGMDAVRELEHGVRELGLSGLNLQPFENKIPIDDRRMYPLYAKSVELDIPVNIHCGINFSLQSSPSFSRPEMLDRVLCDFPELRAIASPPGWPWVMELLSIAWRQPNLWIGLLAVRPKLLTKADSGYGPLLQYGRTVLRDKIIWGSAYPMLPVQRTIDELRALPLEDDITARWLGGNARDFLRI